LAAGVIAAFAGAARAQAASPCTPLTFEGSGFTVCRYRADADELRLALNGPKAPLGSFKALAAALGPDAARVRFAMNAGMFEPDQSPVGLYVEAGEMKSPLQTADGEGNFYLKPNGVFSVEADGSVRVDETISYTARDGHPAWATQSGPLLVRDGALHPALAPDGASRFVRNGVGIIGPREAVFVISDGPVSLGKFARVFRDGLGCRDALYFDGHVSSLWAPSLERRDRTRGLGPLVVVLGR
jgi:uncharacterized protein YigE (DUF2233 family)